MQNITKLCADHLRSISNDHGIKLKASHAHELVAAFFGYHSRAALLADKLYPVNNIRQARVILQTPSTFIDERYKELQDFPLIDNYFLYDGFYHYLPFDEWIPFWTYSYLKRQATILADEHILQSPLKRIYYLPTIDRVKVDITEMGILLTVIRYHDLGKSFDKYNAVESFEDIIVTIWLQRVAGHIGYAKPEISIK